MIMIPHDDGCASYIPSSLSKNVLCVRYRIIEFLVKITLSTHIKQQTAAWVREQCCQTRSMLALTQRFQMTAAAAGNKATVSFHFFAEVKKPIGLVIFDALFSRTRQDKTCSKSRPERWISSTLQVIPSVGVCGKWDWVVLLRKICVKRFVPSVGVIARVCWCGGYLRVDERCGTSIKHGRPAAAAAGWKCENSVWSSWLWWKWLWRPVKWNGRRSSWKCPKIRTETRIVCIWVRSVCLINITSNRRDSCLPQPNPRFLLWNQCLSDDKRGCLIV